MGLQTALPRVLVAEDDRSIGRLLTAVFRQRQMEVELARDGIETVDALQRERWDVIVMDLMMPRVSGWDVLCWLGEHQQHRPACVIVVTAVDRNLVGDVDPNLVNAIVVKPFDVLKLGAYVKNATEQDNGDRRRARALRLV